MARRISSQLWETTTISSGLWALPECQRGMSDEEAEADEEAEEEATCAARCAQTSASRRELLARRLAPCKPVQATSPTAYRPAISVRPSMSVMTPPHW